MAVFTNQSIVVTWEPKKYPFYGCFAVVEAQQGMPVRIKGAGFNPKEQVKITACEKDIPIGTATANACGAFEMHANLPASLPLGVISVKAWVGGVGEVLKAVWPLDIVKELPPFPKG
jgi:hypothetical protein